MWDCFQPISEEFGSEEAASYWAQEGSGIEVEILRPDSKRGMKHFVNDPESYMTLQMKKRGVEVSERRLDPAELAQFREAKGEEVKKFIAARGLEAIPRHLQLDRRTVMKMGWVLTWKKDEIQGTTKAKARCAVLGFLDLMYAHRQVAAPTMGKTSRQMFSALAAARREM